MEDQTVKVPKEETKGSQFGHCSSGVTQTDAVLWCIHMAAVAKLLKLPGFNMGNATPYWMTPAH